MPDGKIAGVHCHRFKFKAGNVGFPRIAVSWLRLYSLLKLPMETGNYL